MLNLIKNFSMCNLILLLFQAGKSPIIMGGDYCVDIGKGMGRGTTQSYLLDVSKQSHVITDPRREPVSPCLFSSPESPTLLHGLEIDAVELHTRRKKKAYENAGYMKGYVLTEFVVHINLFR